MAAGTPGTQRKKLDSWKEIADYLGRDVRTAMRWEAEQGLPVRHLPGGKRRAVFALTDEIDEWLQKRGVAAAAAEPVTISESEPAAASLPETSASTTSQPSPPRHWFALGTLALLLVLLAAVGLFSWYRQGHAQVVFEFPDHKLRFSMKTIPLNGSIGQVQAADLNGDGWPDLIVGGATRGQLAILINQAGTFAHPRYLPSCPGSQDPLAGDFDGDGAMDIVLACSETSEVEIWWGNGKGEFGNPKRWKVGNVPSTSVVADWNGDGLSDVAVGASGGRPLVVLFGNRNRELTRTELAAPSPNALSALDLDGDGKLDLVTGTVLLSGTDIFFFKGHGDGSFDEARAIPAGCHPWRVIAGDFTGDGIPDLVASSIDGTLTLVRGTGAGSFAEPAVALTGTSSVLAMPYSTQDRDYVIASQFHPAMVRLIEFDRNGLATVSNGAVLTKGPGYATAADFNRDGRTDIAILSYDKDSEVYVLWQTR